MVAKTEDKFGPFNGMCFHGVGLSIPPFFGFTNTVGLPMPIRALPLPNQTCSHAAHHITNPGP